MVREMKEHNSYSINEHEIILVANFEDGTIEWTNDGASTLWRKPIEGLLGASIHTLFVDEIDDIQSFFTEGELTITKILTGEGQRINVKIFTSYISVEGQEMVHLIVSESKKKEAVLDHHMNSFIYKDTNEGVLVFKYSEKDYKSELVYFNHKAQSILSCDGYIIQAGENLEKVLNLNSYELKNLLVDLMDFKTITEERFLCDDKSISSHYNVNYSLFELNEGYFLQVVFKSPHESKRIGSHVGIDKYIDRMEFNSGYLALLEIKNYNSLMKLYDQEAINEVHKIIITQLDLVFDEGYEFFESKNIYVIHLLDKYENLEEVFAKLIDTIKNALTNLSNKVYCDFKVGLSNVSSDKYKAIHEAKFCLNQSYSIDKKVVSYIEPSDQSYYDFMLKNDLPFAFENNEFSIVFQGIYDLAEKELYGFEVLVRWYHSKHGKISPDDFIPVAEMTDLITAIDLWVVKESLKRFNALEIPNKEQLKLNFNISPRDFFSPTFVDSLLSIVKASGVNPNNLILELTETLNLSPKKSSLEIIKENGIMIALDDFGTGFASLSQLKKYAIDFLKIDLSFVHDINKNHDNTLIIKAILSMAKNLGIKVIAEGVETEEQARFLDRNDCRFVQGYMYHKPMSSEQLDQSIIKDALRISIKKEISEIQDLRSYVDDYKYGDYIYQQLSKIGEVTYPSDRLNAILSHGVKNDMKFSDLIDQPLRKAFDKHFAQVTKSKGHSVFSTRLVNMSAIVDVSITMIYNRKNANVDMFIEGFEGRNEGYDTLKDLYSGYDKLFKEVPIALIVTDLDFIIKEWNTTSEEVFGYKREEVINNNIMKLLRPEGSKTNIRDLISKLNSGTGYNSTNFNYRKDGHKILCSWNNTVLYNEYSEQVGFISMVKDVTQEFDAHNKLNMLSTVIKQEPSPVVLTNIDGVIEFVNDALVAKVGYSRDELLGKNPRIISSGQQTRSYYKSMWQTILNGEVWEGQFRNKTKTGEIYVTDSRIFPIKNDEGTVTKFACIQKDVTKAIEQENLVSELNLTLESQERLSMIGQMAAGIMHEINNPLSFVDINVHALKDMVDDIKDDVKDQYFIDEIYDLLSDLNDGIEGIKKIAAGLKRFSYKSHSSELDEVDINEEIRTIMIVAKNEYKYYSEVVFEDGEVEVVKADSGKIKQVLLNLVINAVHAIKEKNDRKLGKIFIRTYSEEAYVVCEIEDTGNGIPLAVQQRIFEAFYTTKQAGVGTGLGLSLSKRIIEDEHKGRIGFTTELGVGTTFVVKLPKNIEGDEDV